MFFVKLRCPFVCNGLSCDKEYASKFGAGALKHFHSHLKDPRCVGDIKETMLTYAKDNKIMKILKKRGFVRTEVVAA